MNKIIKRISAIVLTLVISIQYTSVYAFSKEEMVFTNLDVNGNVKSTVVNEHLKLSEKERNSSVEDNSELEKILNINGEESFTLKGNLLTWQTVSKDIYYQGVTSKQVPIAVDVKYYLNGEEKSLNDIEGKAGNVTIKINLTNNLKNEVKINGKNRTLYTPFVVMCGTMIDNKGNSEFSVTNGKVIDSGTKSIIAAISSPGLYDSIKLKELKNLDNVEISYKTEKFDKNICLYIVATPKVINDKDIEIFDKMDDLTKNIKVLQNNMNKIDDGAKNLVDGAEKLEQGSKTLANGTSELKTGATSLKDGANKLKEGATSLEAGVKDLKNGATDISDGISTISSKLQEVASGVEKLENGSLSLNSGLEQIIKSIEEAQAMFTSKEAQAATQNLNYLKTQNTNTANKIKTAYETYGLGGLTIEQIIANPGFDAKTKADLITVKNNYESGLVTLLEGNNSGIDGLLEKINNISKSLTDLKNALEKVKTGSGDITNGLDDLKNGVNALHNGSIDLSNGALKLKAGAGTLYNGANSLKDGTVTLADGANTLEDGTKKIQDGANELYNGVGTLTNGSKELSDGISKFNKDGINKLSSYGNKIDDYSDIGRELVNLTKSYNGFSCNNADVTNFMFVIK